MRALVFALVIVPALAACQTGSDLHSIRERGTVRVGVAAFSPWAVQATDGEWIGFEIDVAERLADDLGAELEIVPLPWEGLIPALRKGEIDVIASGMSITPGRALLVNFSRPYARSRIRFLANRELAHARTKRQEYDVPETRIAVVKGTTGAAAAEWAFSKAKIVPVDTQIELLEAVRSGRVTAAISTSPTPEHALIREPDTFLIPLERPLASQEEAFAIRQGDPDFLAFLDTWVRVHTTSRWLEHRWAYWFLSLDWEERL